MGLDRVTAESRLGRRLSKRDQIIGTGPRQLTCHHGIRVRPRVTRAAGRSVNFADGSASEYDAVVWATGFSQHNTWIDIPGVIDEKERIRQSRGVTLSPGLYTLGLTWQHTRGSALLGWVETTPPTLLNRSELSPHEPDQHGPLRPAATTVEAPVSKAAERSVGTHPRGSCRGAAVAGSHSQASPRIGAVSTRAGPQ